MPWILETYNNGVFAATYNVTDSSKAVVACDLLKLNDAKVICASTTPIPVDQEVKVVDKVIDPVTKVVLEKHTLLHGYVQKYAQITKGITTNTYEYTIKELAVELEKFRVHSGASYTVNCSQQSTSLYAATVLVDSGWTKGSGADQVIQSLQFRYMTGIAALNKLISNLTAASAATPLYMWFDSAAKTVSWGQYRNDRTGTNITKGIYYNYKEEKTVRNQVAGVVIFGSNSGYSGNWPNPLPGGQHDLAVYQYDDATSNQECQDIAKAVYLTWCADPKRRIQFFLRPADTKIGGNYILEGDRIQVDGSNYTIIDMTYTPRDVEVGVNAGQDSALYSLGDKLRPVAGTATGATEVIWNQAELQVSSDGTTRTKYQLTISDVDNIQETSVPLNVVIGAFKGLSAQNPSALNAQLLSDVTLPATFDWFDTTWSIGCKAVSHIPNSSPGYIVSNTQENGFQYALASLFTTINSGTNCNGGYFIATGEYSYNGVNWYQPTYQSVARVAAPQTPVHYSYIAATFIIPGKLEPAPVYVRWQVYADDTGSGLYVISKATMTLDIIPRHAHTLQQTGLANPNQIKSNQTDDVITSTDTPPNHVHVIVNNNTPIEVYSNTPVEIKPYLIDGNNSIDFIAGAKCTVQPSTTFHIYGGS